MRLLKKVTASLTWAATTTTCTRQPSWALANRARSNHVAVSSTDAGETRAVPMTGPTGNEEQSERLAMCRVPSTKAEGQLGGQDVQSPNPAFLKAEGDQSLLGPGTQGENPDSQTSVNLTKGGEEVQPVVAQGEGPPAPVSLPLIRDPSGKWNKTSMMDKVMTQRQIKRIFSRERRRRAKWEAYWTAYLEIHQKPKQEPEQKPEAAGPALHTLPAPTERALTERLGAGVKGSLRMKRKLQARDLQSMTKDNLMKLGLHQMTSEQIEWATNTKDSRKWTWLLLQVTKTLSKRRGTCSLCLRETHAITRHHLYPRKLGRGEKLPIREHHPHPDEVRPGSAKGAITIPLCHPCHTMIHYFIPHSLLAQRYHTPDQLRANESVDRWLCWARLRPIEYLRRLMKPVRETRNSRDVRDALLRMWKRRELVPAAHACGGDKVKAWFNTVHSLMEAKRAQMRRKKLPLPTGPKGEVPPKFPTFDRLTVIDIKYSLRQNAATAPWYKDVFGTDGGRKSAS